MEKLQKRIKGKIVKQSFTEIPKYGGVILYVRDEHNNLWSLYVDSSIEESVCDKYTREGGDCPFCVKGYGHQQQAAVDVIEDVEEYFHNIESWEFEEPN